MVIGKLYMVVHLDFIRGKNEFNFYRKRVKYRNLKYIEETPPFNLLCRTFSIICLEIFTFHQIVNLLLFLQSWFGIIQKYVTEKLSF